MRQIAPLALAALASALMFSSTADAVALGNVASQSGLGQPLRLVIPIVEAGGETINSACLRLVNGGSSEGTPQLLAARINVDRGASIPARQLDCGSGAPDSGGLLPQPPSESRHRQP